MITRPQATIQDLYGVPDHGKAEIVNGELVKMSPTGARPGQAATRIAARLVAYEEQHGGGFAFGDNVGFTVHPPDRESFSPHAAWYAGEITDEDMDFLEGAPVFAVEVRSKGDYGPKAESALAAKIADYFAAGTKVVWDVDLLSNDVIKKHRADDPRNPVVYRRGGVADAEPAVPGWTMPVDVLFRR